MYERTLYLLPIFWIGITLHNPLNGGGEPSGKSWGAILQTFESYVLSYPAQFKKTLENKTELSSDDQEKLRSDMNQYLRQTPTVRGEEAQHLKDMLDAYLEFLKRATQSSQYTTYTNQYNAFKSVVAERLRAISLYYQNLAGEVENKAAPAPARQPQPAPQAQPTPQPQPTPQAQPAQQPQSTPARSVSSSQGPQGLSPEEVSKLDDAGMYTLFNLRNGIKKGELNKTQQDQLKQRYSELTFLYNPEQSQESLTDAARQSKAAAFAKIKTFYDNLID